MDDLYQDIILDHHRNPRNKRKMDAADVDVRKVNPVCGDQVEVMLRVRDGAVAEADYLGQGCSISQASASMLTEALTGKSLKDAYQIAEAFRRMMRHEASDADMDLLGDLVSLEGVSNYPQRVKCAVLAWDTLETGIKQYEGKK
jgi:nitrogen fixation NifU-like protein